VGFLIDSEGTGKLHVKQKQSTTVFIYISKTQSETPVHFMIHVSKLVWTSLTLDFFLPSPKIDSVTRMDDKRKDSHPSNSVICVF